MDLEENNMSSSCILIQFRTGRWTDMSVVIMDLRIKWLIPAPWIEMIQRVDLMENVEYGHAH